MAEQINLPDREIHEGLNNILVPEADAQHYNEIKEWVDELWLLNSEADRLGAVFVPDGDDVPALVAKDGSIGNYLFATLQQDETDTTLRVFFGKGPYGFSEPSEASWNRHWRASAFRNEETIRNFDGSMISTFTENEEEFQEYIDGSWDFAKQLERRLRGLNPDPGYAQLEAEVYNHFGNVQLEAEDRKNIDLVICEAWDRNRNVGDARLCLKLSTLSSSAENAETGESYTEDNGPPSALDLVSKHLVEGDLGSKLPDIYLIMMGHFAVINPSVRLSQVSPEVIEHFTGEQPG